MHANNPARLCVWCGLTPRDCPYFELPRCELEPTVEPLPDLRIPGRAVRELLIGRAGGVLGLTEVAELLGVPPEAVYSLSERGAIIAVPMLDGERCFPACQFTKHGVVAGIDAFLSSFAEADAWKRLAILLAPSAQHGGESALELLARGRAAEARSLVAKYADLEAQP